MLAKIARTDTSSAQLFIRIALAAVIFPHGAQKALGWFGGPGFTATIQAFSASGYSAPLVLLLMAVETLGPLLLVTGFLTRIAALGIGASMTVCMFANHVQNGFFMNWFGTQAGEGYEYHLLVIGMCLALLVRGGGLLSIDLALTPKRRFTSTLTP
jgi:putative oxidoreductase